MYGLLPSAKEIVELIETTGDPNQIDDYGASLLHKACEHGDIELVRLLLDNGADIELVVTGGMAVGHTGLSISIIFEEHEVLSELLQRGARTDYVLGDLVNETPLTLAAEEWDPEAVRLLLSAGADPNYTDQDGRTTLHELAMDDTIPIAIITQLLDSGAQINVPDDLNGSTPLHIACKSNNLDAVRAFLSNKGVEVSTHDFDGNTALDIAVAKGHLEIVKLFKIYTEHGNDAMLSKPDSQSMDMDEIKAVRDDPIALWEGLDKALTEDWTPLQVAVNNEDLSHVQELIDAGADVDDVPETHLMTEELSEPPNSALGLAARKGNLQIVRTLIEAGGNIDFDDCGTPPLHEVLHSVSGVLNYGSNMDSLAKHEEVFSHLLITGADITLTDRYGRAVIARAAEVGWLKGLQLLVAHGADLHYRGAHGETLLHFATDSRATPPELVEYLVSHGVDASQADNQGVLPLHNAARKENEDVVRLLIEKGSDPNAQDGTGKTALHHAAGSWDDECIMVLLHSGANLEVADESGSTVLHLAAEKGVARLVELLISSGAKMNSSDLQSRTPLKRALQNQDMLVDPSTIEVLRNAGACK